MMQIPDAPWIRDAEINGMDCGPDVQCPICGRVCDDLYVDANDDVVGCGYCVKVLDSADWYYEELEKSRPD